MRFLNYPSLTVWKLDGEPLSPHLYDGSRGHCDLFCDVSRHHAVAGNRDYIASFHFFLFEIFLLRRDNGGKFGTNLFSIHRADRADVGAQSIRPDDFPRLIPQRGTGGKYIQTPRHGLKHQCRDDKNRPLLRKRQVFDLPVLGAGDYRLIVACLACSKAFTFRA